MREQSSSNSVRHDVSPRFLWLGFACVAACATARPVVPNPTPIEPPLSQVATVSPQRAADGQGPRLQIRVTPDFKRGRVTVAVTASADAALLREFRIAVAPQAREGKPWSLSAARDRDGPIPYSLRPQGHGLVVQLDREPAPPVELVYELSAPQADPHLLVTVAPAMFHASGEAVYMLPQALGSTQPVHVELLVELRDRDHTSASSFGLGRTQRFRATVPGVRASDVVAGALTRAEFDGAQGHDIAAVAGSPQYDFRWVAAEVAGLRSELQSYFGAGMSSDFGMLMLVHPRRSNQALVGVSLRTQSMILAADPSLSWDGQARLPVATALAHRWLGGVVRISDRSARDGLWFAQGFPRAVARDVLYGLGALTDDEYVAELNGLEAELVTSRLRGLSNAELVARGDQAALRHSVARGALYAARLAAKLRARGRSLQDLLGGLVRTAVHSGQPELPLSVWRKRIETRLGADEVAVFDAVVLGGAPLSLPANAFGPCFRRTTKRYVGFDLGFDASSFVGESTPVQSVAADGPAYAAGLRDTDTLLALDYRRGDAQTEVELAIERDGEPVTLRYFPRGDTARGRVWVRRAKVAPELCAVE